MKGSPPGGHIFKECTSVLTELGRGNSHICDRVIIEVISALCSIVWLNDDVSWKNRFGQLVIKN